MMYFNLKYLDTFDIKQIIVDDRKQTNATARQTSCISFLSPLVFLNMVI